MAWLRPGSFWMRTLPDFDSIRETELRKAAFTEWLSPQIESIHAAITADRERLLQLEAAGPENTAWIESGEWVRELSQQYRLELPEDGSSRGEWLREALLRVDEWPVALVLAQAALESGWGTSRYAREGNNLFGLRCFSPGCGLLPGNLRPGQTHRYQSFTCPLLGLRAYYATLNAHPAYSELRLLRATARASGAPLSARDLLPGLQPFAQNTDNYLGHLDRLLIENGWEPAAQDSPGISEATH